MCRSCTRHIFKLQVFMLPAAQPAAHLLFVALQGSLLRRRRGDLHEGLPAGASIGGAGEHDAQGLGGQLDALEEVQHLCQHG